MHKTQEQGRAYKNKILPCKPADAIGQTPETGPVADCCQDRKQQYKKQCEQDAYYGVLSSPVGNPAKQDAGHPDEEQHCDCYA